MLQCRLALCRAALSAASELRKDIKDVYAAMRVINLGRVLTLAIALIAIAGWAGANSGNESIATASPLDWSSVLPNSASASGTISLYDVDYYQLQVYQGGTVDFELLPVTGGLALQSPRIDIFDPLANVITGVGGTSLDVSLNPGVYYPRISSGNSGFGLYSLAVNGANSGSPATAQIGAVDPAPEPSALTALCIGMASLGGGALRARFKRRA